MERFMIAVATYLTFFIAGVIYEDQVQCDDHYTYRGFVCINPNVEGK